MPMASWMRKALEYLLHFDEYFDCPRLESKKNKKTLISGMSPKNKANVCFQKYAKSTHAEGENTSPLACVLCGERTFLVTCQLTRAKKCTLFPNSAPYSSALREWDWQGQQAAAAAAAASATDYFVFRGFHSKCYKMTVFKRLKVSQ